MRWYKQASSMLVEKAEMPDGSHVTLEWNKHNWGLGSGYSFVHTEPAGADGASRVIHHSRPYPNSDEGQAMALRAFRRYVARKKRDMPAPPPAPTSPPETSSTVPETP